MVAPSFAVRMKYQRVWMRAYQRQLVDGRHVWDDYDVNALSLYPKPTYGHRTGGPEDAMRLLGRVRGQLNADRRAGDEEDLGDRGQLRRHGWRRGRQHRDADLRAPSGGQCPADLPARRGPRADPGVLVPLRLGAGRRRHSRQHPALRSHELRPRARRRHGHPNGGALAGWPAGRPAREPPVRARPARHLPLRGPARRSRPADLLEPTPRRARAGAAALAHRNARDVPSPATRAGTPCASGSSR